MGQSPPDRTPLGRRILQARLDLAARLSRPVTQAEIAQRLGVTGATVGRWEAGAKEPTLATIERLAAALEVSPAWLAFGAAGTAEVDLAPHLPKEIRSDQLTPEQRERADRFFREAREGAAGAPAASGAKGAGEAHAPRRRGASSSGRSGTEG